MKLPACILLSFLSLVIPAALHAQYQSVTFESWRPSVTRNEAAAGMDSVQARVGSRAGRGAAIGAGIGLGVGLILGAILAGGECADCDPSPGATVALSAAAGAGLGALIGLLAGLSTPRYEWREAQAP